MRDKSISGSTSSSTASVEPSQTTNEQTYNEKTDNVTSSKSMRPALAKLDSKLEIPVADPLANLPEHEAEIIKRQIDVPSVATSYFRLYRFASRGDIALVVFSQVTAIIGGAILPLMTVVFGNLTGLFRSFYIGGKADAGHLRHEINRYTLYFVYMAIAEFVFVYISTVISIWVGEHITGKIRENYLAAVLRQNIGYFDALGSGEITTRITADTNLISEGISEKTTLTSAALATFFAAFVIGFIRNWRLTLILTSTVVAINMVFILGGKFIVKYNKESLHHFAQGGTVAEEVLASIRNAVAFGTQKTLADKYDGFLAKGEQWGIKQKRTLAIMISFMMCIVYLNYALAFWEGSRLYLSGDSSVQTIITVLLAILIGAFALGNVAPNFAAFSTAVAASAKIYSTIDRVSPMDVDNDKGKILDTISGEIELRGIKMIYPSRAEVTVIENMNLVVPAGKVTALVGASGSGKSTIVGLVERFYDPVEGEVLLDGHNIQGLNLKWLREQVALVQQEPILFNTTIYQNVAFGLIGTSHETASDEVKHDLIVKACEMANAASFISLLPDGYETNVGERGFSLSGGQKQRIAIARAVVSDPKILLLDEATSALDTRSEGVVQAALDKASQGRTTITIAHRLSTIKNADNIVVMTKGVIVETGRHDELLERRGPYYNLVEAQKLKEDLEHEPDTAVEDEKMAEAELIRTQTRGSAIGNADDQDLADKLNRTTTTKSLASVALAGKTDEQYQKYPLWTLIKVVARFNRKEWGLMSIAFFFCLICGAGYPVQAVFFSKSIVALSLPPDQRGKIRHEANFWSGMYLMLAGVQLIAYMIQGVIFAYCAERLVHRVRDSAFRSMLRQEVAFFDREENSSGALTSFLSTETNHVAGMSGVILGTIISVTTTLVAAVVLSLAIGWKLALVCASTIPILLACGFLRFWLLARFAGRSKKAYERSAAYACEATNAIRTVASLTREKDVWRHYHEQIVSQERDSLGSILRSSTLYAISQSFIFLCTALGFWFGGHLIAKKEYSMFQFFVCFQAIIFGAQSAGAIFSFSPEMSKSKNAAQELKQLLDREPEIDINSNEGEKVPEVEGHVEFRDVHFRYPTRPGVRVLSGVNLKVKPGQYVALVGASGCGKSTSIALMERFYNPLAGAILVDGKDISTLNVNEYRNHIALVSQEPVLYMGTIRENILLGGGAFEVTEEDIVRACKEANIYDFIMSLPDGFETLCGTKGSLLSGGQKQRICIARAIIRRPRILLLDEATSALDSESETVVQAALDAASRGRSTMVVAHRLSTIQNADKIYVFDEGKIVEEGTHATLMALKGRYAELVNLQSLGKNN